MKLDKNQQKELVNIIRAYAKKNGYKTRSNSIYCIKENAFVHCDYLIINSEKIIYRIYVKEYEYDNIFWEVMQMKENANQNNSLRACGAFKAPSILLKKGEIELTYNYEHQAEDFVKLIDECSCDFIKKYDIDEYIINNDVGIDNEILKCLALFHLNKNEEALRIAKDSIDNGNKGNYENEGKAFFEWVLLVMQ